MSDVGGAIELRLFIFAPVLVFGTDAHRTVTKETAVGRVFVGESVVRGFGTRRTPYRIDEDVVLVVLEPEDVGDDVLRDATLLVGTDATLENDVTTLHLNREIIDVERAIGSEMLANEPTQLVVAQVVDVMNVFEVAGHGSSSSREQIGDADRERRIVSPYRLIPARENRRQAGRWRPKVHVGISDGGQSIREIGAKLIFAARHIAQGGAPGECKAGAVLEVADVRRLEIRHEANARFHLGDELVPASRAGEAHPESEVRAPERPTALAEISRARRFRRIEDGAARRNSCDLTREMSRAARTPLVMQTDERAISRHGAGGVIATDVVPDDRRELLRIF